MLQHYIYTIINGVSVDAKCESSICSAYVTLTLLTGLVLIQYVQLNYRVFYLMYVLYITSLSQVYQT